MSRRSDYLDYIVDGGFMSELPAPVAPEDNGLYKMAVGGFGMEKARGIYRCKIDNSNPAGIINFIGGFVDSGNNAPNSVKIKLSITASTEESSTLPTKIGLRLFANNSEEKEDINGGYSKSLDDLVTTNITHNTRHTIEATFDNSAKTGNNLELNRYLKPFITLTNTNSSRNLIIVHEFTIQVNDVVYDITDTIFNFMEGLESNIRYIKSEIPTCAISRRKMPFFGKKLACLGDSITFGFNPEQGVNNGKQLSNPWGIQLRHKCGFLNTRNYGVTGRRISEKSGASSATESFFGQVATMDINADVITVMGGINDFAQAKAVGTFQTPETVGQYDTSTFYGAVQQTYYNLQQRYKDKLIVVINMLNGNNGATNTDPTQATGAKGGAQKLGYATVQEGMDAYREVIRTCAKAFGFPCLELQDKVSFDSLDTNKITNIPDLLHPNQAGHNEMSDIIADFINSLV